MHLLDTDTVSELRPRRSAPRDPRVMAWAATVDELQTYISAITLLKLEIGVLRVERRDREQGRRLRQWLRENVAERYTGRVLAFDHSTSIRCARLHVPDVRPYDDAVLAATALEHNLTLVTRNVRDFGGTGLSLFNPWESSAGGELDAPPRN